MIYYQPVPNLSVNTVSGGGQRFISFLIYAKKLFSEQVNES